MILPFGRRRGRVLARLTAVALATTLAGSAAATALADSPTPSDASRLAAVATPDRGTAASGTVYNTPFFFVLDGVERDGSLFMYAPDRTGNFGPRDKIFDGDDIGDFKYLKAAAQVDNDKDGYGDATYYWMNDGKLSFTYTDADGMVKTRRIGGGWQTYSKVLSPGNVAGAKDSDILAVDKAGVLWLYLARPDGTVTPRVRVGAGWGGYTQLAGQGDLTGDGRADLVARDKAGVLWLYKGTGNATSPFAARKKIGGGWNGYNYLHSSGDVNRDGIADLLARAGNGTLYIYRGTGKESAPYAKPVKAHGSFGSYRLMF
ncbi:VCBS repeat-containing protein [Streptomyces lydicus]|uniref:FG-GAP repeat domain-containing protein n=1 Tax=Streptomyces lydicus TaxID=47763 RepID=UPI002E2F3F1E|nr:VCBS repeat-containing protein [Streptomyces lydicus]